MMLKDKLNKIDEIASQMARSRVPEIYPSNRIPFKGKNPLVSKHDHPDHQPVTKANIKVSAFNIRDEEEREKYSKLLTELSNCSFKEIIDHKEDVTDQGYTIYVTWKELYKTDAET